MIKILYSFLLLAYSQILTSCGTRSLPSAADSRESSSLSGETVKSMREAADPLVNKEACVLLVDAPYSGDSEPGKLMPQTEAVNLTLFNPEKCSSQVQVRRTEKEKPQWTVSAGQLPVTDKAQLLELGNSIQSVKLSISFTLDSEKKSSDDLVLAFEYAGSRAIKSKTVRICGAGTCDKTSLCSGIVIPVKKEAERRFTCALNL